MKNIIVTRLAVFLLTSPASAMTKDETVADFVEAGIHYRDGDYRTAAESYQEIVDAGWESGPLYYNLGNSYFRQGESGRAILNYERAALLMPRDADLRHNRRFAYSSVNLSPDIGGDFFQRALQGHIRFYTLSEMVWVIYAVFLFIIVLHLLARIFRWRAVNRIAVLSVLVVVMTGYVGGLVYKIQYDRNTAFVVESVEARFEPREGATTHFRLKEGSRVTILRPQGPWVKIKRSDGRMGWIPDKNMKRLQRRGS